MNKRFQTFKSQNHSKQKLKPAAKKTNPNLSEAESQALSLQAGNQSGSPGSVSMAYGRRFQAVSPGSSDGTGSTPVNGALNKRRAHSKWAFVSHRSVSRAACGNHWHRSKAVRPLQPLSPERQRRFGPAGRSGTLGRVHSQVAWAYWQTTGSLPDTYGSDCCTLPTKAS